MQGIERLLRQVVWGPLDYLLIDMPPGTGDTQLSISQNIPVSGSIIVTTPQQISLTDASRAIVMYRKIHVPLLGLVQNMSHFICPGCKKHHQLFGSSEGCESLSRKMHVTLLAKIPFDPAVMECNDQGLSICASQSVTPRTLDLYRKLATDVLAQLKQPLD